MSAIKNHVVNPKNHMENIGLYAAYYIQSFIERRSDSMNNYQNGVMPYSECTVMDSNHRTQMGADLQSAVVAA